MRNLTIVIFIALASICYSQNEITTWQEIHPEIIFIEQADFNQLSDSKKSMLDGKMIVYSNQIKQSDILAFENTKQFKHPNAIFNYSDFHAQDIKNWLGQNKDIITMHQSEFDSLSTEKQSKLIEANALVFSGDFLTLNDIISYEESH